MVQYYVLNKLNLDEKPQSASLIKIRGGKVERLCGDFEFSNEMCFVGIFGVIPGEGYSVERVSRKKARDLQQDYNQACKHQCIEIIARMGAMGFGGGMQRLF